MISPFQCILFCTLAGEDKPTVLLAASRCHIFVFSITNRSLLSTWQDTEDQVVSSATETGPAGSSSHLESHDHNEGPNKRQKRAPAGSESDSSSAEIVTEDGQRKQLKSSKQSIKASNVIKLTATSDGRFIVAISDEDKCVRVLQLAACGKLQQLSKRQGNGS